MAHSVRIDFESLSVIGLGGADLIEQTEGVPPVEEDGYEGFVELMARLGKLNYEGAISPEEYEHLRCQIRNEAKRRGYDRVQRVKAMNDQEDKITVRVEMHDKGHKTTVATSHTEALKGAKRIAKRWKATVNPISENVVSFEFLSAKHQENADMEMFEFWLSDTNVDCFKSGPIPYAAN